MNTRKTILPLIVLLLVFGFISFRACRRAGGKDTAAIGRHTEKRHTDRIAGEEELNRDASYIHYSKHARCRMACRHIDETEIKEILQTGEINYGKSELTGDACHKKYAVEGYSRNRQHLRVIFAPCGNELTVVTCIDLGTEWPCNCETGH